MPKHGSIGHRERFRALDSEALRALLDDLRGTRISARLARYAYRELELTESGRIAALKRIAGDDAAPWAPAFLWRELDRHRTTAFGDWVIVAMGMGFRWDPGAADLLIAIYHDPDAHPMTRGSAMFGLNHLAEMASWEPRKVLSPRVRETCAQALWDMQNPYARAGACWLAQTLGGFDERVSELADDDTPILGGCGPTVGMHVNSTT